MTVRRIEKGEIAEALRLVLDVFMKYEAPDYVEEGIRTFRDFISSEETVGGLDIYGAFIDGEIAGVIATRNGGSHIALFFVAGNLHRRGIGRALFEEVLKNAPAGSITVNSSPYAVGFYRRLGFGDDGTEQLSHGIRYTPMTYTRQV